MELLHLHIFICSSFQAVFFDNVLKKFSPKASDVNKGGGPVVGTPPALIIDTLSTAEHERIIDNVIRNKCSIFFGIYNNHETLSGFMQEGCDSANLSSTQQKVNGIIGRKGNYGTISGKHALRQQARRRRRNTSIAAGNSPPITRVTMKAGGPSAACSPSGASPTRNQLNQSGVVLQNYQQRSQYSPHSSQKASSKSVSNQVCSFVVGNSAGVRSTSECLSTDSLDRIMSKINYDKNNVKNSLDNCINYQDSHFNYLDCSRGLLQQGRDSVITSLPLGSRSTLLQPSLPVVRSSLRLATGSCANNSMGPSLSSSYLTQSQSGTSYMSTSQSNRTLRVCPPQSSPSTRDSSSPSMTTMQCYLSSIPGFKPRKRSQRKLSTAAQLAQTKEGNIDLETPDSILVNVNLKSLINVETFSALPPSYQHKLAQLLPRVDQIIAPDNSLKVISTGFHNEFLARACLSWKDRLSEGEFTHDNQVKLRGEVEKERSKLDPWKVAHFEPVWGMKQGINEDGETDVCSPLLVSVGDESESPLSSSSAVIHGAPSPVFTDIHIKKLTKVIEYISNKEQRRKERRAKRAQQIKEMEKVSLETIRTEVVEAEEHIKEEASENTLICSRISQSDVYNDMKYDKCEDVDRELSENDSIASVDISSSLSSSSLKRKNSPVPEAEHFSKKLCFQETSNNNSTENLVVEDEKEESTNLETVPETCSNSELNNSNYELNQFSPQIICLFQRMARYK
ncbi:Polycomb protein Asx [Armadillidium vulgare]|nr:Polycomb protein Asx [Armadillidium vulgare]